MTNLFLGFNRDGLRLKCVTFAETNNRSPPAVFALLRTGLPPWIGAGEL